MIRLIIDGKTADLNGDGLILLTYQNADAEHPAAVRNSYSQNITLPPTPANDTIFSHILRSDFRTGTGFNPLARTPFEIRNESQEILVSGYLKLNSGDGKGYSISLFGGLGGFFYSLMYLADGTKRDLASMDWPYEDMWYAPAELSINVTASYIAAMYEEGLREDIPYAFAPFNEGLPKDFDANKAWYRTGGDAGFKEINTTEIAEGVYYYPKNKATSAAAGMLLEMGNGHDAWGMEEFRNTLQRPLWSIRAFLQAVQAEAEWMGYTVEIDPAFFNSTFVQKGWVTMKCNWGDKITNGAVTFADLLDGTQSPTEYLLSIAKVCGLMFSYDEQGKRVKILTRNSYYGEHQDRRISLHGLIAEDKGKTVTPILTSDKWQILSAENYGGRAAAYAERKGRQYGSLWIDTNYEFGGNENDVLSESAFKGAADTLATNIDYRYLAVFNEQEEIDYYVLKFGRTDTIQYTLYTTPDASGQQDSRTFSPNLSRIPSRPTETPYSYRISGFPNVIELPQFCDGENAQEDGDDVILFYKGMTLLPKPFYATEANADMLDLNGGKPCWDLSQMPACAVSQFPTFQRQIAGGDPWSALFARPGEFFTPMADYYNAVPAGDYLGERAWSRWLAERCGVDVRRMRCWVNLRNRIVPKVGADLLRYFWYYEGAWWVLDKVSSHSLTTDDLTECEFVKVVDIRNYIAGQRFSTAYLLTADGYRVLTADSEYVKVSI